MSPTSVDLGGFKLELLDRQEQVLDVLGPPGFLDQDPTQQALLLNLPQYQCLNCTVKLFWGKYRKLDYTNYNRTQYFAQINQCTLVSPEA